MDLREVARFLALFLLVKFGDFSHFETMVSGNSFN